MLQNSKNLKTLIVHPKDSSTTFLEDIYKYDLANPNLDYTLCTKWGYEIKKYPESPMMRKLNIESKNKDVVEEFEENFFASERFIFLGHGTPKGLISYEFIFSDPKYIKKLKESICIFIWCNADMYVDSIGGINGWYSGMFISEVGEAAYYDIVTGQRAIDISNYTFSKYFREVYNKSGDNLEWLKTTYAKECGCEMSKFNAERLYCTI